MTCRGGKYVGVNADSKTTPLAVCVSNDTIVAEVQALLADAAAVKKTKTAVRSALASQLRVDFADIAVELSAGRRLAARNLQAGALKVDYTVAVADQAAAEDLVSSVTT